MENDGRTMVSIIDCDYEETVYNILLNEKEIRFLNWLSSKSLLSSDVTYNIIKGCSEDFT